VFNKLSWSDDWIEECTAMLEDVLHRATSSPARNHLLGELLNDALQAHRGWALDLQREATQRGLGSMLRSYTQNRVSSLPFNLDGQLHEKSAIAGIVRTGDDGESWVQQEMLARSTFREIAAKRSRDLKGQRAYSIRVALDDKLLALEQLAPGTETPEEACAVLGVALHDYLAESDLAA
jgi:hypothetical protein